ncbi:MAG: nucleoside hydrolase-like domain-containing protein [Draconibacterium sp.]
MITKLKNYVLVLILFVGTSAQLFAKGPENNRLIVLIDIDYTEPDDAQSLIRLLLYSNQIDIQGLIATTNNEQRDEIYPDYIRKIIGEYDKVQPNLLKHEKGFPTAQELLKVVKEGLPLYGMKGVGKGNDSEGSEWIIAKLEENDDRPLWINVWGGSTVLAQSLWKIQETKSKKEASRLISKLRVYAISDQDDSGAWIRKTFPDLFYIVTPGPYEDGVWGGIMNLIPGLNNDVISNFWLAENVQQGHGPLGAIYPNVVFGVEGDTPSFLYLLNNGLNSSENPNWGSWGGRYEFYKPENDTTVEWRIPIVPETRPIWTNAEDTYTPTVETPFGMSVANDTVTVTGDKITLARWREDFQNDFAARMDWCVKEYEDANHPPVVKLVTPANITVKSGEIFHLDATECYDPDGDGLIYYWFNYREAGTCTEEARLFPPNSAKIRAMAPKVDKPETVHFILKVTDRGTPRLSRYARVVVTVEP